jgi:ABC-type hemin transport system substrate-binding protein
VKDQIRTARTSGNVGEAEALEKQLAAEVRRLQQDCEEKKEKLRRSFGS